MKRISLWLAGLLVLVMVLSACGDSTATVGTSTGTSTPAAVPTATNTTSAVTTGTTSSTTTLVTTSPTTAGSVTTTTGSGVTTTAGAGTTSGTTTTTSGVATTSGTTSASGLTQGQTGLPLYTGGQLITIGNQLERTLVQPLAQQLSNQTSNVRYSIFTTSDTPDKVITYYDEQMNKAGLTKVNLTGTTGTPATTATSSTLLPGLTDNLVRLAVYQQGSSSSTTSPRAGLAILGPMDATIVAGLGTIDSTLATNVKAGDILVILVNGIPSIS